VVRFTNWLRQSGNLHETDLAAIEADIAAEIDEAVAFAEAGTWEPADQLTRDVYAARPAP